MSNEDLEDMMSFDDSPPQEMFCPNCSKMYEDFSDMGCGQCDQRHPEFGIE